MNQEIQFFEQLFAAQAQSINLLLLLAQIVMATLLSLILAYFYVRYGQSLSNRRSFSRNFPLIAVTTMLIIMIVKSSLALSLGLVGALSIVRFRTAIKEPEELAYFFMVIGVGLGIGAEQLIVTTIGTVALCAIIFFLNRRKPEELSQNLVVRFGKTDQENAAAFIEGLKVHCTALQLRRLNESADRSEMAFDVSFKSISDLLAAKQKLQQQFPDGSFSFLQMV